jgi:hypothetical protein
LIKLIFTVYRLLLLTGSTSVLLGILYIPDLSGSWSISFKFLQDEIGSERPLVTYWAQTSVVSGLLALLSSFFCWQKKLRNFSKHFSIFVSGVVALLQVIPFIAWIFIVILGKEGFLLAILHFSLLILALRTIKQFYIINYE